MTKHTNQPLESSPFFGAFRTGGFAAEAKVFAPNGDSLELAALPPILRTLLTTDGTVTKCLEAYFWEPIEVVVDGLQETQSHTPISYLNVQPGEPLLVRDVRLKGKSSGVVYAQAHSVIRLSVLTPDIRAQLVSGEIGIGVLIRDSGLESYREILDIHAETISDEGAAGIDISRVYRIIVNNEPTIAITETFPLPKYQ